MSQTYDFYDARAREAAVEASQATLDNVRERNLRAEKTWRGLANQARRVADERAKALRERDERREDETSEGATDENAVAVEADEAIPDEATPAE